MLKRWYNLVMMLKCEFHGRRESHINTTDQLTPYLLAEWDWRKPGWQGLVYRAHEAEKQNCSPAERDFGQNLVEMCIVKLVASCVDATNHKCPSECLSSSMSRVFYQSRLLSLLYFLIIIYRALFDVFRIKRSKQIFHVNMIYWGQQSMICNVWVVKNNRWIIGK